MYTGVTDAIVHNGLAGRCLAYDSGECEADEDQIGLLMHHT